MSRIPSFSIPEDPENDELVFLGILHSALRQIKFSLELKNRSIADPTCTLISSYLSGWAPLPDGLSPLSVFSTEQEQLIGHADLNKIVPIIGFWYTTLQSQRHLRSHYDTRFDPVHTFVSKALSLLGRLPERDLAEKIAHIDVTGLFDFEPWKVAVPGIAVPPYNAEIDTDKDDKKQPPKKDNINSSRPDFNSIHDALPKPSSKITRSAGKENNIENRECAARSQNGHPSQVLRPIKPTKTGLAKLDESATSQLCLFPNSSTLHSGINSESSAENTRGRSQENSFGLYNHPVHRAEKWAAPSKCKTSPPLRTFRDSGILDTAWKPSPPGQFWSVEPAILGPGVPWEQFASVVDRYAPKQDPAAKPTAYADLLKRGKESGFRTCWSERLLLVQHASACTTHSCAVHDGHAYCSSLQSMLPHVLNCSDPKCKVASCNFTRSALEHYFHCNNKSRCAICRNLEPDCTLRYTNNNAGLLYAVAAQVVNTGKCDQNYSTLKTIPGRAASIVPCPSVTDAHVADAEKGTRGKACAVAEHQETNLVSATEAKAITPKDQYNPWRSADSKKKRSHNESVSALNQQKKFKDKAMDGKETDGNSESLSCWTKRLLLLDHATKCSVEDCAVHDDQSTCSLMKSMLPHMLSCSKSKCTVDSCNFTRVALEHFSQCGDKNRCPVCRHLRTASSLETVAAQATQLLLKSDQSAPSADTPEDLVTGLEAVSSERTTPKGKHNSVIGLSPKVPSTEILSAHEPN